MKELTFIIISALIILDLNAQNTFNSTGNASIGTSATTHPLTIKQPSNNNGILILGPSTSTRSMRLATNGYGYPEVYSNDRLDLAGQNQIFITSPSIYFEGNTIVTRTGDPSSYLTSKGSRAMPFQANIWNGSAGVFKYAGLLNVASTTQGLITHRLAFKVNAGNTDLSDGTEGLSILSNGSVGISTTDTKSYKLAVNGTAIFTKAIVKTYATWADYVFDPSSNLPTLQEVEQYILLYRHLPEVPSAAEVEENGIDLGDNQTLLLKKVEELTLYLIDLSKKNDAQQKEINALRKTLEKN